MMGYYGGWGWGAWLVMALTMVVVWGLIAWLVVMAVRAWGRHGPLHEREDARRILDERFARGELSEEEYLRARSVLETSPGKEAPR